MLSALLTPKQSALKVAYSAACELPLRALPSFSSLDRWCCLHHTGDDWLQFQRRWHHSESGCICSESGYCTMHFQEGKAIFAWTLTTGPSWRTSILRQDQADLALRSVCSTGAHWLSASVMCAVATLPKLVRFKCETPVDRIDMTDNFELRCLLMMTRRGLKLPHIGQELGVMIEAVEMLESEVLEGDFVSILSFEGSFTSSEIRCQTCAGE